jgi:hypothetical protein
MHLPLGDKEFSLEGRVEVDPDIIDGTQRLFMTHPHVMSPLRISERVYFKGLRYANSDSVAFWLFSEDPKWTDTMGWGQNSINGIYKFQVMPLHEKLTIAPDTESTASISCPGFFRRNETPGTPYNSKFIFTPRGDGNGVFTPTPQSSDLWEGIKDMFRIPAGYQIPRTV